MKKVTIRIPKWAFGVEMEETLTISSPAPKTWKNQRPTEFGYWTSGSHLLGRGFMGPYYAREFHNIDSGGVQMPFDYGVNSFFFDVWDNPDKHFLYLERFDLKDPSPRLRVGTGLLKLEVRRDPIYVYWSY